MEEFFIQLTRDHQEWAYAFLFFSAFLENVFPPVPGDTVTLIGAYFVGVGVLDLVGVLVATTLGSVVGFMTLFGFAYRLGWDFFQRRNISWLDPTQLRKVEGWFGRFGFGIIFANRFLPGVRSVISISAGLSRLNTLTVALLATVSAAIWNGLFIYAGAIVGKSKDEILAFVQLYNRGFFIVLG
nr:DedA family protein [Calditrichia bacterium]